MQNRDAASFSRPQNAQMVSELTVGWGGTCGANIGGFRSARSGARACEAHPSYNYPMLRRVLPLLALGLACTRTVAAPTTVPAPVGARPALPPVPAVDGPLAISVVYPRPDQVISSRDSNFIFGSIGSGRATLRINGAPARVYPNGAFIAFVANPPGPSPRYELLAERGGESIRTTLNVAYPPVRDAVVPPPAAPGAPIAAKPEDLATSRADTLATLFARIDSLRGTLTRGDPI